MNQFICTMLENYSNLILAIMDDNDPDPLWHRFYQIQMANFLLGQKDLQFDVESALQVYSRISDCWEQIRHSMIKVKDYENLFKSVCIDFPIDRFTVCQNGPKICRKMLTVSI